MKHTGGCQCGAVRFITSNSPVRVIACHCKTCKRRTGSPYGVGVYFNDADVAFNQGERRNYPFNSETTDRWLRNEFCPICATTISWTLEMRPGARAIAAGCFDDTRWYTIDAHVWTESARDDMRYPENVAVFKQAYILPSSE